MSYKSAYKEGVPDMTLLTKITSDAIIENLKKRYLKDAIYSNFFFFFS